MTVVNKPLQGHGQVGRATCAEPGRSHLPKGELHAVSELNVGSIIAGSGWPPILRRHNRANDDALRTMWK
jgi:hypothetical protein